MKTEWVKNAFKGFKGQIGCVNPAPHASLMLMVRILSYNISQELYLIIVNNVNILSFYKIKPISNQTFHLAHHFLEYQHIKETLLI